MRPENPSDRNFFRPQLRLCDPCTHTNVSSSKILSHYAENEHFPPQIPRSLLSAAPCDNQNRHSRGKGLAQSCKLFSTSTLEHDCGSSEVTRLEINNGQDLNILRGFPRVLSSTTARLFAFDNIAVLAVVLESTRGKQLTRFEYSARLKLTQGMG